MLVVGLGNPGEKYKNTRHNTGFMVIDKLANKDLPADVELLKPNSGMNNSGEDVKSVLRYSNLKPDNVWVIYDDVDLKLGKIRFRQGGSTTHKGVESIIKSLGSDNFKRIRIGIGPLPKQKPIEKFVLQRFSKKEMLVIEQVVELTADKIIKFLNNGFKEQTHSIEEV